MRTLKPTKYGIKEQMLLEGKIVYGSREWKREYHRRYMVLYFAQFPDARRENFKNIIGVTAKKLARDVD